MRPELLDDLGLEHALNWFLDEFHKRTSIKTNIFIDEKFKELPQETSVTLYRITQECLTNVARHSNADSVTLSIEENESDLLFSISDNGKGICEEEINDPKSLGLLGIKERAYSINSSITIEGKKEVGTTIKISIPK